jgi:hypothetical protein
MACIQIAMSNKTAIDAICKALRAILSDKNAVTSATQLAGSKFTGEEHSAAKNTCERFVKFLQWASAVSKTKQSAKELMSWSLNIIYNNLPSS